MFPEWRLNPLTDDKLTREALWPSEGYPAFVCRRRTTGSTREAAKPFSIGPRLDSMMKYPETPGKLGAGDTLVTGLSATARGGTRSALWHNAAAVYQRLSRQSNLNLLVSPERVRPCDGAAPTGDTGAFVFRSHRGWDTYAQSSGAHQQEK